MIMLWNREKNSCINAEDISVILIEAAISTMQWEVTATMRNRPDKCFFFGTFKAKGEAIDFVDDLRLQMKEA